MFFVLHVKTIKMSYQTTNLKKVEFLIYKEKIQKMIFKKKKSFGISSHTQMQPKYEISSFCDKKLWRTAPGQTDRRTDGQTDRRTDRIVKTEDL